MEENVRYGDSMVKAQCIVPLVTQCVAPPGTGRNVLRPYGKGAMHCASSKGLIILRPKTKPFGCMACANILSLLPWKWSKQLLKQRTAHGKNNIAGRVGKRVFQRHYTDGGSQEY